jgi:dihydrofolate reductase
MKISCIVATDLDFNIGKDNGLPWRHMKEDMQFFTKITTAGHNPAVVMGRNTWEGLPERHRPLKNRINIVVSTTLEQHGEGYFVVGTPGEAVTMAKRLGVDNCWCIGGGQLYSAMAPLSGEFYVTTVEEHFEGCDTKLDKSLLDNFVLTDLVQCGEGDSYKYRIDRYTRAPRLLSPRIALQRPIETHFQHSTV